MAGPGISLSGLSISADGFPFLLDLDGGGLVGASGEASGIFCLLDRRPEELGCEAADGLLSVAGPFRFRVVGVAADAVGTSAAAAGAARGAGAEDWAARLAA